MAQPRIEPALWHPRKVQAIPSPPHSRHSDQLGVCHSKGLSSRSSDWLNLWPHLLVLLEPDSEFHSKSTCWVKLGVKQETLLEDKLSNVPKSWGAPAGTGTSPTSVFTMTSLRSSPSKVALRIILVPSSAQYIRPSFRSNAMPLGIFKSLRRSTTAAAQSTWSSSTTNAPNMRPDLPMLLHCQEI